MASTYERIAENLSARRQELATRIAGRHLELHPEFLERWGAYGRVKCTEDADYHLRYLVQALRFEAPSLFVAYTQWARQLLEKRGIPWSDLQANLEVLRDELAANVEPQDSAAAGAYIDEALRSEAADADSFLASTAREPLARAYLTALLRADRRTAIETIDAAQRQGVTIRELYLHVFQPVQREIGRLWQNNEISVAEEHYCTASTQALMAQFYPQILATPRIGRKVVVACVGNELHEIGTRMVADFFEMDGWDGVYLGANTPSQALVDMVCRERPDMVALGVTMTYHLGTARELLDRLRGDERCTNVKILVGGYVFQLRPELWRTIGADGCAADASEAVAAANRLIDAARASQ